MIQCGNLLLKISMGRFYVVNLFSFLIPNPLGCYRKKKKIVQDADSRTQKKTPCIVSQFTLLARIDKGSKPGEFLGMPSPLGSSKDELKIDD
jgi:hypothetical protein